MAGKGGKMKQGGWGTHVNSIQSRVRKREDRERLARNRKKAMGDHAAMERWGRRGCVS